jgi:Zn-dependent membrane protease YugP
MFLFADIFFLIVSVLITIWAQFRVRGAFKAWSQVAVQSSLTGQEIARRILDRYGLNQVAVETVSGSFSDHYDPSKRVVRLSETVYTQSSIAAISVAAHECGHALQHQEDYGALVLRHRLVPLLSITSGIAPFLLLIGFFLRFSNLILVGILFFLVTVVFHLVTLPVEFNASSRAKQILAAEGMVTREEERGVNKVLNAAAFTYVAGALVALVELLRFILYYLLSQDER